MPYLQSASPDISESIPAAFSVAATSYPLDAGWDVTFGDLGFLLRPTDAAPYRRETDQVSKQQIDTSDEAGEQTLSTWWLRSQASWHMGAGVNWYEPGADKNTEYRFASSYGVNPWSLGELTLLHKCNTVGVAVVDVVNLSTAQVNGVDGYIAAHGSTVLWAPDGGTETTATLAGSGATQPAVSGSEAWVGHSTGIAKYDAATGILTEPLTASNLCQVWWVKSRLIVAAGAVLYELTASDTGVLETVGTSLYTHPDATWVWTDVAEVGEAILAAGYSDSTSAIYRFTVDNDENGQPRLSGASQVAQLPPGEQIRTLGVYLGTYLILGTTSGLRVGVTAPTGEVQYGPLTIECDEPITDVTFRDRFVYAICTTGQPDGSTGAARVDLSAPIGDTGRYAWAWDVSTGATGEAESLCFVGQQGRVVLAAGGQRYVESATEYVAEGVLTTGRIRFATTEPKAFRLARLISTLNAGRIKLTALAPDDSEHRVYTYADQSTTTGDVGISITSRPTNQHLSFKMTLYPDTAGTASPVVQGFSVKAVPAPARMRLVQYPVSVYDFEVSRSGQKIGVEGGALSRLLALERLEDSATPVTVRHLAADDSFVALIESVAFSSAAPPDRNQSGFGGTALVTVRKL